jgi:hypothetical protein
MVNEEKKKLIGWIDSIGHSYDTELAIPLHLYFNGNDEKCCIITCNTIRAGSAEEFYTRLKEIERRTDVNSVWIRFYDYDDALKFDDCWINSDGIWIVTTASKEDVMDWLDDFEPTESYYEDDFSSYRNPPEIPTGFKMVGISWD